MGRLEAGAVCVMVGFIALSLAPGGHVRNFTFREMVEGRLNALGVGSLALGLGLVLWELWALFTA